MKRNRLVTLLCPLGLVFVASLPSVAQNGVLVVEGRKVGILNTTPGNTLHIKEDLANQTDRVVQRITGNDFFPQFEYQNAQTNQTWRVGVNPQNDFVINDTADTSNAEFLVTAAGVVMVNGTQVHPDYVFDEGYDLMPLDSLKGFIEREGHLPRVLTSQQRADQGGIDLSSFPLQLLEKIEELTLYAIDQHQQIQDQQEQIQDLVTQNQELVDRLGRLEQAQSKKARR